MIVIIRLDIDDDRRRALRYDYGKTGLATRKEILSHLLSTIEIYLDDKLDDMERAEKGLAE